jgi:hypothetical protein
MERCTQDPLPLVALDNSSQLPHTVACVLYGPKAQTAPWETVAVSSKM